jgi:small-conductance mechanosensitive channel
MMSPWWNEFLLAVALAVGIALVSQLAIWLIQKIVSRRVDWVSDLYSQVVGRVRIAVSAWAVAAVTATVEPLDDFWWPILQRAALISLILFVGAIVAGVSTFALNRVITRYSDTDVDSPDLRRIKTQVQLIKRLLNVAIGLVAIGLALFTFPQVQAVGAGLLASAGVLSVIGGLAAQATLGNLFAGIQLAFSNAIRVDDVVVVEGEWGRIGEITLSYVVVYIWDDRRLVVPSTYFTSKHYETWTRHGPRVLGVVMFDLDWRVPLDKLRAFYEELLHSTPLWDGRVQNVLAVDATGGYVTVRCVASAKDSSDQWDLRCLIREKVIEWVRTEHPEALPIMRVQMSPGGNSN